MKFLLPILIILTLYACSNNVSSSGLPVIGFKKLEKRIVEGKEIIDSIEHTISEFKLINQDSTQITDKDIDGKIYIADFFFTSCPTICPKVKKNMKKVYEKYYDNEDFLILSHSIDFKYDTVGRLKWYADKFKINSAKWHLLTGDKDQIYALSSQYYIAALENEEAPGGYDHSGAIALIDRNRRIRGLYDGTDIDKVDDLIRDIELLMKYE